MSFDTNPKDYEPIDREEYEKYEKQGIFDEIIRERIAQDAKWGGHSHDNTHSNGDWCTYIDKHNARAANGLHEYRYQMIRVAALAIAAIQAFDRNERVRESTI